MLFFKRNPIKVELKRKIKKYHSIIKAKEKKGDPRSYFKPFFYELAKAYDQLGDYEKAVDYYQKTICVSLYPDQEYDISKQLAVAYFRKGGDDHGDDQRATLQYSNSLVPARFVERSEAREALKTILEKELRFSKTFKM